MDSINHGMKIFPFSLIYIINLKYHKMKVALVCIAKDEDNYIKEWINYHLSIGFSKIYVYQNDWNFDITNYNNVEVIKITGCGM